MTIGKNEKVKTLEKLFFAYILKNPVFFHRVEAVAFKNPGIQFVYARIRNYYLAAKNAHVPSPKVIRELVRCDDPEMSVSDDFIRALLSIDIKEYTSGQDDDWLRKQVQSWCTSTNIFNKVAEASLIVRTIDPTNPADVMEKTELIRTMMQDSSLVSYGDEDLGLDFDDPESHVQDTKFNKVTTGWISLDELLSGGWDKKTLNMVIGPSNSGKSLWLCNIAVNAANEGKNVLYISLEMSDKKIMKRLGAIRLRVNINEYDTKSKDVEFIKEQIAKVRRAKSSFFGDDDALFAAPVGKMYVKDFPAGSATIADVDAHIKNLQEKKGVKIDMVVVDYLTIMAPDKNANASLFTNGKQLSEGLRAIAQKHDLVMVSAMQVQKANFGANDITLADIAESKAIVETADTMFGIIRTDPMRAEGVYVLKLLKLRDGDFKWERTHFKLNKDYLAIEGDKRMDMV